MKAVLMSIQPKWCELIASGKKTVEVRKTKPKIKTPFKVYIYCTRQKVNGEILLTYDKKVEGRNRGFRDAGDIPLAGKVIGEFVCSNIAKGTSQLGSCLSMQEISEYANGKEIYGWCISNLKIYDKPKELSEFYRECEENECDNCPYLHFENTPNSYEGWCMVDEKIPIKRPPQSWCYVEEKEGADNV